MRVFAQAAAVRAALACAALILVPTLSMADSPASSGSVADGTSASAPATDAGDDTPRPAPPLTGIVDTVEVVSDRPTLPELVSTFATVHDVSERIDRVASVSDVIEEGAGVHVRRYGGLGAYSTASVRASSPGQVEIYLDGVPLNSTQWGAVNLAELPLDTLDRIEVYRSGAPLEFGSPGVGGVVNLVTREAGPGSAVAAVSAGSHGTFRLDFLRSGRSALGPSAETKTGPLGSATAPRSDRAALDYAVAFHHLQSEGDFEYLDRHGTPENVDDDEIVTRENNDFAQTDLLVKLRSGPWAGWDFEIANETFDKRSGVPGVENVHIKSVHYRVFRNAARVSVEPPSLASGALSLRATGFHVFRRDRFYNPEDEVGFDRWDSDDRAWSYGGNVLARFNWHAAHQSMSVFAETRRDRFIPENDNPNVGVGFTRKRSEQTLTGEDKLFLLGGNLELVASYLHRETSDNFTGPPPFGMPPQPLSEPHRARFDGPAFGARWRLHPNATLKANWTSYVRFPSMVELFGASGYVEGNSELEPEEGTTFDVGIELSSGTREGGPASSSGRSAGGSAAASAPTARGAAFLEIVFFRADRDDLIVFLQNSQRTVKAFNLEAAEVEGVEVTARSSWSTGLELSASYTYQDARNVGPSPTYNGKRLPYEPAHAVFLRSEWNGGRYSVWHELHHQGEVYRDRANLEENLSPASSTHNVGASYDLLPGALTLSLEVQNVADERLVDVEGYPLPGRTLYATLTVKAM